MAIAATLEQFLTRERIEFSVVGHSHTCSSSQ